MRKETRFKKLDKTKFCSILMSSKYAKVVMSLYNLVNGVTPASFLVLPMLGKHPNEYPRFRDCFITDESHPQYDNKIHVYVRVGGNNRNSYKKEIAMMRNIPGFIADYDDDFDNTYASFIYEVPKRFLEDFQKIKEGNFPIISKTYRKRVLKVFPKIANQLKEVFHDARQSK